MRREVIGDRREHVRRRSPDVALAIAVEILRELEKARRHELRLPHGAGPGPAKRRRLDVLFVEDLQGGKELFPEHGGAARIVGERGQRGDGRAHAAEPSEVRLESPDRDDERGRNLVFGAHLLEQRGVLLHHASCGSDRRFRQASLQVLIEREHQLRLASIALEDDGDRFEAVECMIERRLADTAGNRFRSNGRQPFRKGRRRGRRRRGRLLSRHGHAKRAQDRQNGGGDPHHATYYAPGRRAGRISVWPLRTFHASTPARRSRPPRWREAARSTIFS